MSIHAKRVLADALELPPVDRAELIESILSSFDSPSGEAVDAAWAEEAEDRIEAYDRGEINPRPVDDMFDDIDKRRSS